MIIYSIKNNIFKYFYKLKKIKKNILLNNSFSVEVLQEIKMALIANYIPEYILIYNKIFKDEFIYNFFIKKYMITFFLYKKISYIKKTGAILRTADAVGIYAILLCNNKVDIFNTNVIRSSLGTIFPNKIVIANSKIRISWLNKTKMKIISTSVNKIYNIFFIKNIKKKSLAIIIGYESKGLSDIWLKNKKNIINIPIKGKIYSLNVSTSTAIILAEIFSQKLY